MIARSLKTHMDLENDVLDIDRAARLVSLLTFEQEDEDLTHFAITMMERLTKEFKERYYNGYYKGFD